MTWQYICTGNIQLIFLINTDIPLKKSNYGINIVKIFFCTLSTKKQNMQMTEGTISIADICGYSYLVVVYCPLLLSKKSHFNLAVLSMVKSKKLQCLTVVMVATAATIAIVTHCNCARKHML